jgi:hypothetical protein
VRKINRKKSLRKTLGLILYSFTEHLFFHSQPLYIAWWDYFDEKNPGKRKTITIEVGNIESVKITEAIPNAECGAGLKDRDYTNFFLIQQSRK